MNLRIAHSYLVHPAKGKDPQPIVSGTKVPDSGSLHRMLAGLFERSPDECDIQILFRPDEHGNQENACRDLLEAYARNPTVATGRAIALRLQSVTTNRSGLGLMFLLLGVDARQHHTIVLSRFPAEQGVVAQEDATRLSVEFIERVFMKNAKAYKCAIYSTESLDAGFGDGRAIDRQISRRGELSEYWIGEFLNSELRTTGPHGTRRFAEALRDAVRTTSDPELKQELVSAARLVRGQDGQTRSVRTIMRRLGVSDEAVAAIVKAYPRPELVNESFRFSAAEFVRHTLYQTVELDNGGTLMAEAEHFDDVFNAEPMAGVSRVRYTTEGKVIDQRFRKTK